MCFNWVLATKVSHYSDWNILTNWGSPLLCSKVFSFISNVTRRSNFGRTRYGRTVWICWREDWWRSQGHTLRTESTRQVLLPTKKKKYFLQHRIFTDPFHTSLIIKDGMLSKMRFVSNDKSQICWDIHKDQEWEQRGNQQFFVKRSSNSPTLWNPIGCLTLTLFKIRFSNRIVT